VFTPSSIRRDAAALWKDIPEPIQKDYTKEYFDGFVNNMIKYSVCGVRYTVKPGLYVPAFCIFSCFMDPFYGLWQMPVRRICPGFCGIFRWSPQRNKIGVLLKSVFDYENNVTLYFL
jgi:hypothetical protein